MLTLRLSLVLLALTAASADAAPETYRQGAERFIADMTAKHGFDPKVLADLLGQATYRQSIIDAMNRPYEGKPWRDYRRLFLTPERIQGGAAFWTENADALSRAEADYGVKPEIIVAIIGVETSYGANLGSHRALDALTTLGFAYPKRADFFRSELEAFLLLAREEDLSPVEVRGSYAGAFGKPQFISSSYRAYAVDYDTDGRRDLWRSNADVVGSVANYFKQHGWRSGESVAFPARLAPEFQGAVEVAEKRPLKPSLTLEALQESGVAWDASVPDSSAPAVLILLDGVETEHWVGLQNFYVITRYNHSNLYAMAVHQLSQAIRAAHAKAR
ncbi:lytic murein transglycosylase B [Thiocystis violacea]|uniref:lytic murein transglycosylase B n=1 Tax=Thiocystis violacea TaxID=13725 RepID=UPI001908FF26|nr:lytic murein transglycosylase B [Thiocystis violacea]MBK1724216.1 lytic murein transglycosylase B [Thiocystis violacea]